MEKDMIMKMEREMIMKMNDETMRLTYTPVEHIATDAALEETTTSIATIYAIMFAGKRHNCGQRKMILIILIICHKHLLQYSPVGFVTTDCAQHGHR